jgi:uncharacterized protein (TIGR00296 family)
MARISKDNMEKSQLSLSTKTTVAKNAYFSLRGCIGCFDNLELGEGIRNYTLTAALQDSRFSPVKLEEVEGLSCTVSLLTNFEPGKDCYDWSLQFHGIRIKFKV